MTMNQEVVVMLDGIISSLGRVLRDGEMAPTQEQARQERKRCRSVWNIISGNHYPDLRVELHGIIGLALADTRYVGKPRLFLKEWRGFLRSGRGDRAGDFLVIFKEMRQDILNHGIAMRKDDWKQGGLSEELKSFTL